MRQGQPSVVRARGIAKLPNGAVLASLKVRQSLAGDDGHVLQDSRGRVQALRGHLEDLGRTRLATTLSHPSGDGVDIGRQPPQGVVRLAVDPGYRTHRPARRQRSRKDDLAHVRRQADPRSRATSASWSLSPSVRRTGMIVARRVGGARRSSPSVAVVSSNRMRCMVPGILQRPCQRGPLRSAVRRKDVLKPREPRATGGARSEPPRPLVVRERVGAHPTCFLCFLCSIGERG
jgi:hypothetical protein